MASGEIDTESEMTNATSFKDSARKGGIKGGVQYTIKKIDRLINGEPVDMLPPSVRKAARAANVDDFRAQLHNESTTEKSLFGLGPRLWRRSGEKLKPEFKNVYPRFESWWLAFAKRQMQLYPPEKYPFGPGEKSPVYSQWEMARSFYENGQVKIAKVRAAFDDPQFYNTTMMFIEHEATLKMHAIAVKKEFARTFKSGGVIRRDKVRGSAPDAEQMLAAGLELDAVIMLIALVASATGFVPLALLSPVFFAGLQGAAGMVGGAAIWELGRDGVKRLIDGIRKNGDIRVFTQACEASLNEIRSQPGVMKHMKDVYGLDPAQITINPTTQRPEFTGGTTSNSWEAIQDDLNSDIRLREMFLTDLVKVDRKRAHALTEQFLTESDGNWLQRFMKRENKFIVNQTGARYEEEVLAMFDSLRVTGWPERGINPNVPLDHAHQAHLQMLYMEASRRVLRTKANKKFDLLFEDQKLQAMLDDGVEAKTDKKTNVIGNRRESLSRGITEPDGRVTKEGVARTKLKEQAVETQKRAQILINGALAEGGNPPKVGLIGMEKTISPTEVNGLFKRKELVGSAFTDIVSSLRKQGFRAEAQAIETDNTFQTVADAEAAVFSRKTNLENTTLPPYNIGGGLEQAAETDRVAALEKIRLNNQDYTGKGGDAAREAARQAVEQTKTTRMATIERERNKFIEQVQDLENLLVKIRQKREEIQSQFDALSLLRSERVEIANTPEEMQAAYERVGTSGFAPGGMIIADDDLSKYGQTGYLMRDYFGQTQFQAARAALWPATEDEKFENQKIILLAVAEVKAKEIYHANTGVDLYANPTPVQIEIVGVRGGATGAITKEQLIALPPHRVREILDANAADLPVYSALNADQRLTQIKELQHLETQRYVARQKALELTKAAHTVVVAQLGKAVEQVDRICDAKMETIALVEAFLGDRGAAYHEVRNMMTTESLERYAYGASVQASPNMTPIDKKGYSLAERQGNFPRGFLDFLRDIFKYHELGRDLDKAKIDNKGPDKLYDVLIDALGGTASAQMNIANMIVDSFQPTIPPGEGFRRFVTPPALDVHTLPFTTVMSILAYRNDPTRINPPAGALPIQYADPLTTQDMLSIVQKIAGTIADSTAGSAII